MRSICATSLPSPTNASPTQTFVIFAIVILPFRSVRDRFLRAQEPRETLEDMGFRLLYNFRTRIALRLCEGPESRPELLLRRHPILGPARKAPRAAARQPGRASSAVSAESCSKGRSTMRASLWLLAAIAVSGMASFASANDQLLKLEKDANQWAMPTGDYANHRYS